MTDEDRFVKFERYSDDIRAAMRIANREAKWQLQPRIEPHHLLVAMLIEKTGLAGHLLRLRGLKARHARKVMNQTIGRGRSLRVSGKLPLTSNLQFIIAQASEYAVKEKHDSVGTGGMLLAVLCHDPRSVGMVQSLGIDVGRLESDLRSYLHRFMVEAPGQVLHFDQAPEVRTVSPAVNAADQK